MKKSAKEILKQFWKAVVKENDEKWIQEVLQKKPNRGPCGDLPEILRQMLDKGVSLKQITRLVRIMQYQTLFQTCYILNGNLESDKPKVSWELVEINPTSKQITGVIANLDEFCLKCDPEENEMCPPVEEEDYSTKII